MLAAARAREDPAGAVFVEAGVDPGLRRDDVRCRGGYAAYGPPPGYDGYPPRTRRYYAAPRRPPRGLYSGYSSGYGYGF